MKVKEIIQILKPEAMKSDYRTCIGSCLVYKNNIISISHNSKQSPPFQKRFSKNEQAIFFHTETSVIHKAIQNDFKAWNKTILYVFRWKFTSSTREKLVFGNAKPCSGCLKAIKTFKIPKIIYSLDEIEGISAHFGEIIL